MLCRAMKESHMQMQDLNYLEIFFSAFRINNLTENMTLWNHSSLDL